MSLTRRYPGCRAEEGELRGEGGAPRSPHSRGVQRLLAATLDLVLLNLALLLASVPVVTIPVAACAAVRTLDRWWRADDDRVVRNFAWALTVRPLHTSVVCGAPLALGALCAVEVVYFGHYRQSVDLLCLGLGAGFLVILAVQIGYVLLLAARYPNVSVLMTWQVAAHLARQNLLVTGPLLVAELVAIALLGFVEPALAALILPAGGLGLLHRTAAYGVARATRDSARDL